MADGIENYGGSGKPLSYWQSQAKLLHSGTVSRETTTLAKQHQLNTLGRSAYMDLYPEIYSTFGPTGSMPPRFWELKQKIAGLRNLMSEYYGPEGATIRWFIGNRLKELQYRLDRGYAGTAVRPEYDEPPIPDWMQPFLTPPTIPAEPRSGRRGTPATREVQTLRPLGAQAELTPEQMRQMAGYQAWGESGAPTRYSEQALRGMSDIDRWWDPYTRLSESLFPRQQKLTPRWATASQR